MNNIADISTAFGDARATDQSVIRQRTLKSSIGCAGVGLHSGHKIQITLHPAPADHGIVFRRVDLAGAPLIPARFDRVVDTRLCTCIGDATTGIKIGTIEHLMAALAGHRIDNALIDIDADEIPVMDGSSAPFTFLIDCVGVEELDAPRMVIEVLKPVEIEHNGCRVAIEPANGFHIDFEIEFASKAIANQRLGVSFGDGIFVNNLARARTFGFLHEVEAMRAAGLALGGSLDNAVVLSGDEVMNEEGLRYEDEFVRHKILDALGDLYTAGHQLQGKVTAYKSGHMLNNMLLQKMFADKDAWRFVPMRSSRAVRPEQVRAPVLATA
ncbi:MAG: UDP-3-O-acyl-N-acetylglucosamine deacetylase [Pseudomonadota bacterium]